MKRIATATVLALCALALAAAAFAGEQIAYTSCHIESNPDGYEVTICDIYLTDPNGLATVRLTDGWSPSWSPDGTRIAFDGTGAWGESGSGEISVIDLRTGSIVNLTNAPASMEHSPAWSPDGSRIAFSSDRSGTTELYVMNADGSNVQQLTHSGDFLGDPAWSHDSSTITYTCSYPEAYNVCRIGSDGLGEWRVAYDAAHATWSPVSQTILFIASVTGSPYLATMNADGSGVTPVGSHITGYAPAWSPDATRIAYEIPPGACDASGYCNDSIYTANADGSNATFIAGGSGANWTSSPLQQFLAPPVALSSYWCDTFTCSFDARSSWDNDSTPAASWNFGDGATASGDVVNHTFAKGTYVVTLTETDSGGLTSTYAQRVVVANDPPVPSFTYNCSMRTCSFNGSASSDPDGSIVRYEWNFGDGTTATGVTTTHTFASANVYPIYLIVYDNDGGGAYQVQYVTITNTPPAASFTFGCTRLTCTFDGSSSSDPDGPIRDWSWTFGDGASATGATATHTYAAAATYTATLVVHDNDGAAASQTKPVTTTNTPPVAAFTRTCTLRTCTVDASASSDPDGTIASYAWDFGDGATSSAVSASHPYAPGTYTLKLSVTDNLGATNTKQDSVTIVNAAPVASFTSTCSVRTCTFDGSASSDSDGTIVSSIFTFGDATSALGPVATHTFPATGTYTVHLSIVDNDGAEATKDATVTAVPSVAPTASFTVACTDLSCTFDGSSSFDPDGTVVTYAWTFSDGATASGKVVSRSFPGPGTFTVTLTVTDNTNDSGSTSRSLTVSRPLMHAGDLDGVATKTPPNWKATVTVTMHDAAHAPLANATVAGSWSTGQQTTCVTNAAGQCAMSLASVSSKSAAVTFTLQTASHPTYDYQQAANHDPDGDSNGTSISLKKP